MKKETDERKKEQDVLTEKNNVNNDKKIKIPELCNPKYRFAMNLKKTEHKKIINWRMWEDGKLNRKPGKLLQRNVVW